ncbi:MAG: nicotinate-nucleotide adenylyltransferase [Gammaproteobacteria bacterium]|nr:nicotinate-nucleotide adenylyltransferase [Gammaproteobacteria bacterium]
MNSIGIFGGTFDPIHNGHLRIALEALEELSLSAVHFIPCGQSPLRSEPAATNDIRLKMVKAAVEVEPRFIMDTREIKRDGPSYTYDTLTTLRDGYKETSMCLILGMDSFISLPRWYRWEQLIDLAHIVIAHRPGWKAPTEGPLGDFVQEHLAESSQDAVTKREGSLFVLPVTQLEISATKLRSFIRLGLDPKFLVPESVRAIIKETECYA